MSERWAVELVEAMRGNIQGGGAGLDGSGGLIFAEIKTASPLTILAYDQVISKGLYINPALTIKADDDTDLVAQEFQGLSSSPFPFLKEFHQKSVIKRGDTVVLLQVGTSFCILEKVVPL